MLTPPMATTAMHVTSNESAEPPVFAIAASGMDAQQTRLRIIAENLANQDSTGLSPGSDPYRRKTVTFREALLANGETGVSVDRVGADMSPFEMRYQPSNSAADKNGYVKLPNVSSFVEIMDMREAERSFEADLRVMQSARTMLARTLGMLR